MKPFRLSIPFCVILLLSCLSVYAVPAFRGKVMLTQPDGTEFSAMLRGDEFLRILTTAEGHAIIREEDGYYCYATYGPDGSKQSTGYRVGTDVPSSVLAESRNIPYSALISIASTVRRPEERIPEEPLLKRINMARGITKAADGPSVKHGIVILAEFQDVHFHFNKTDFENLLSQQNYSVNGATGSAKEYFDAQFHGQYEFEFDVYGPVRLSKNMVYYGSNQGGTNDLDTKPHEMILEACQKIRSNGADFSKYDDDGDGIVDNVYVFYAGGDEAQFAGEDHIWAHAWYLTDAFKIPHTSPKLSMGNVSIDRYACSAELSLLESTKTPVMTGIGTFCHEYSHTLGLMDMYDTDRDGSGGTSDGLGITTSLMDGGNYNNSGRTPPYFNAIEREMTGILEPEMLALDSELCTISPISDGGKTYRIDGNNKDEYYLIECRDNSAWDRYIGGCGMLIYHVDKSGNDTGQSDEYARSLTAAERWKYNEVNNNPDHKCADLVNTGGGYFFPNNKAMAFTPKFWNGQTSKIALDGISLNDDGSVSFSAVTPPIGATADVFQDMAIITWKTYKGHTGPSHITFPDFPKADFEVKQTDGVYSFVTNEHTIDGKPMFLNPWTEYKAQIYFKDKEGEEGKVIAKEIITFKTARYREGMYPYIFLKNVERNDDGTFKAGTRLPLALYNAVGRDVTWYMNDVEIKRSDNGYYKITGGGILKAVINLDEGHTHTIVKEIIVR